MVGAFSLKKNSASCARNVSGWKRLPRFRSGSGDNHGGHVYAPATRRNNGEHPFCRYNTRGRIAPLDSRFGIPVPTSPVGPAGNARYRACAPSRSRIDARLLLARTHLQRWAQAGQQYRLLEQETGPQYPSRSEDRSRSAAIGLEMPRRLGMPVEGQGTAEGPNNPVSERSIAMKTEMAALCCQRLRRIHMVTDERTPVRARSAACSA